jgi:hypothetical protein
VGKKKAQYIYDIRTRRTHDMNTYETVPIHIRYMRIYFNFNFLNTPPPPLLLLPPYPPQLRSYISYLFIDFECFEPLFPAFDRSTDDVLGT